ncbi:MAG TPA: cell division protein ZapA [Paracoccaceae bacterium]|nr:cell division protein ZapA [Paracoccaceae bacterium]
MPEITLEIGGRPYRVACDPGEEESLRSAARLFDGEVARIVRSTANLPENRALLMAGLLLADRLNGLDARLRDAGMAPGGREGLPQDARPQGPSGAGPLQPSLFADEIAEEALTLLERTALRLETLAEALEAEGPGRA